MRHPLRSLPVAALLGVALLLAGVSASQPLHLHQGASAGLYNEEHVLAALDSVSGDAPLPHVLGAVWLPLFAGAALLASGLSLAAAPLRHPDSRAPPLV